MTFLVMCPSEAEYAKANADSSYAPKEDQVGVIEASSEKEANVMLTKAIRAGKFPKGSCLVEE